MSVIYWDTSWELGVEELDTQHKKLVDIVNSISKREKDTMELLKELIFYVGEHFISEEVMMMRARYPTDKILRHKKEHDFLRSSLLEFSFKAIFISHEKSDIEPLNRLLEEFASNWFRNHFLKTDKDLANWLKEVDTEEKLDIY